VLQHDDAPMIEPGQVMARLAFTDRGIANNRAEAIRWALARIGERPAYGQLRQRTREHARDIERLKGEF
jgi:hypothetical protein